MTGRTGSSASFNRTFRVDDSPTGWWVTPYHFGIDQGPVVLMIENYRTGLIWDIMRRCPSCRRRAATGRVHRRVAVARRPAGDPHERTTVPINRQTGGPSSASSRAS